MAHLLVHRCHILFLGIVEIFSQVDELAHQVLLGCTGPYRILEQQGAHSSEKVRFFGHYRRECRGVLLSRMVHGIIRT